MTSPTITEVFALNGKSVRSGTGGVLPDAYLDYDSAKDMAQKLAGTGKREDYKELETVDADPDFDVLFWATDGVFKYEVIRLRIAY
jgi:hypothetical protein